ncbi:ABC transporter ATP-binding protein [Aquipseudomonas alcaligenes]|uniref:ABC transporter ATP-binding protein n=1 Tax=Aquipseudomonas alcaligenes TaxID=43263 RepID=UPI003747BEDC
MTYAIQVDNLGKRYMIKGGHKRRPDTLRDEIMNLFKNRTPKESAREFWALRELGFEIAEGDKVGIIGKNGAGKSTLLKLLSRVTEPTTGEIRVRGRVSSLLEVGTGFHPELSGRENIFLNGVVLGMSRMEVRRKFDEIVEFAGVADFLDTQVKHYSSGMYMRLAFSVAAHLDPDILIVDEVLAVGDAEFQKKCLGKMQEIGSGGRTVLFVSHSMQSVTSLCNKCILLENGRVKRQGSPSEVVLEYFGGGHGAGRVDFASQGRNIGDAGVELLYGEVLDHELHHALEIDIRKEAHIRMGFRVKALSTKHYVPNFHFTLPGGTYAFVSSPQTAGILAPGDYEASCRVPGDLLNEGTYAVGLAVSSFGASSEVHFFEQGALSFNVKDSMDTSVGRGHGYGNIMPGSVRPLLPWTIVKV